MILQFVDTCLFWLKSGNNNGLFTWKATRFSARILSVTEVVERNALFMSAQTFRNSCRFRGDRIQRSKRPKFTNYAYISYSLRLSGGSYLLKVMKYNSTFISNRSGPKIKFPNHYYCINEIWTISVETCGRTQRSRCPFPLLSSSGYLITVARLVVLLERLNQSCACSLLCRLYAWQTWQTSCRRNTANRDRLNVRLVQLFNTQLSFIGIELSSTCLLAETAFQERLSGA
jgi:hypothetical protein